MWLQAPRQDRDEGDLDESDEVLLGPLEDGLQPLVAANPSQRTLDPNTFRNEGSAVAAGTGFDGDAERLSGLGQPLAPIAEIAHGARRAEPGTASTLQGPIPTTPRDATERAPLKYCGTFVSFV